MKLRRLKFGTGVLLTAIGITMATSSCNNSDESGKNSTSATTDTSTIATNNNMNTAETTSTAPITKVAKKVGRASVKLMTASTDNSGMKPDNMGYYNSTDVLPAYPGGQSSLEDYINSNIEYPQEAIDNNVEGTVNVQFTIDDKGRVANTKTTGAKLGYGLEEAAMKAVTNMPKWTPGMVKGKVVKAWYTLPVTFKIEG